MTDEFVLGSGLFFPARLALLLFDEFKVEAARTAVRGIDPELDRFLAAWRTVASAEAQARLGSVPGTAPRDLVPGGGESAPMGTEAVAELAGMSSRGVRRAVDRGELAAALRIGHALLFSRLDVAVWLAKRAA